MGQNEELSDDRSIGTFARAKALQDAGVPAKQAEAHAVAAREHIMPELATRSDIEALRSLIERRSLLITVRLGGLLVIGVGALAAIAKFG